MTERFLIQICLQRRSAAERSPECTGHWLDLHLWQSAWQTTTCALHAQWYHEPFPV